MIRSSIILIIGTLLAAQPCAGVLQAIDPTDSSATERRQSPAGAIITVSLIAAAGAGVGGFFLHRKRMREQLHADSVIDEVERTWDSAAVSYANEEYREAISQLQSISGRWYEYERLITKYRQKRHVDPDSIKAVIASCDFLERMIQPIKTLGEFADRLPTDEFGLSKVSRRELVAAKHYLRRSMDSIMTVHSNHRNALLYSFRHIERRLQSLDSLVDGAYGQQKADFAAKSKFHYNRAVETNDTSALRAFVDDCDYFQVDKEWCQRARLVLAENGSAAPVTGVQPSGKLTIKDSINLAFTAALQSKRIEAIEAYIGKYSARRYRQYLKIVRLDSARTAIKSLRAVIDAQMAFSRAYPRFGNGAQIPMSAKGLSHASETAASSAWRAMQSDIAKLPSIRLPAKLSLDYTRQPPTILLDALCAPEYDVEKTIVNSRNSYRITCLLPAMRLLQRCKALTTTMIKETAAGDLPNNDVIDYEVKKVGSATYVLRLVKPGSGSSILFYARDPGASSTDTSTSIQFYDFYDIATAGNASKRFPIYPGSLPNIIPSLASDSLEQKMGMEFFGE